MKIQSTGKKAEHLLTGRTGSSDDRYYFLYEGGDGIMEGD